jgi:lipoyl(octanoyl) transferase
MSHPFRLLYDMHCDGATNMARDEAISNAVSTGAQLPTLRFYGWTPAAISLGMSQRISTVNEARCTADGVGVVRRSTGGLAILHTDEFTYSVALPIHHPIAEGDVLTSYRRISEAIMDALRRMGVAAVQANRVAKDLKATGPVCFEAPSDYEVVGGPPDGSAPLRKLVGSAQWRRVDGVLQHGSLPLSGDIGRVCAYLNGAPDPERVRAHAATLSETLGREIDWHEVAEAWRAAFAEVLNLEFTAGNLSADEQSRTDELLRTKYASDVWTRRK